MSLFNRKSILLSESEFTLGALDYTIQGAYDNVKTYPLEVKAGKKVFVEIKTSAPIDVSLVDTKGMNAKFKENYEGGIFGPVEVKEKGIMTMILGIYRGEKSQVEFTAWME